MQYRYIIIDYKYIPCSCLFVVYNVALTYINLRYRIRQRMQTLSSIKQLYSYTFYLLFRAKLTKKVMKWTHNIIINFIIIAIVWHLN